MFEKFRNRYRIPSCRLPGWDYSRPGAYFITMCTKGREPFFGYIDHHQTYLTEEGRMAFDLWASIPVQFPGTHLDEFVIMPDHVHGILFISDLPVVETRLIASLQPNQSPQGGISGNKNPMLNQNVSRIIRWYKGRCCFEIRKTCPSFSWQARFYDRVIRDQSELDRIRDYVRENPMKW